MSAEKKHLKRSMGLLTGVSIVIGTVIGSGIFFKQAEVLQTAGGTTEALLAWAVGGFITLAAGLTIAEVGARIPETGGLYAYMGKLYGKFWGFLTGWMQVVVYAPGIIASLSAYFAYLFTNFFGLPSNMAPWIAVITIFLVTVMNSLDNRIPSAFQVMTTSIKLLPIIGLIVYGLFFGNQHALGQTIGNIGGHSVTGNFGMAVLATLFAYDGWATLTNLGGELKNPRKTIPRSIIIGILIVILAYMGVSYGVYRSLPAHEMVRLGNNVPYAVAKAAFGELGGRLLSIGVMVSMLGTLNGKLLAFPRMVYAMSEDGLLPKFFRQLNRYREPFWCLWVTSFLGMILCFTTAADWLSDLVVFAIWMFYMATFVGVFKLRMQAKRSGTDNVLFQVPLYPVVPLIAIGGALFIAINTLIASADLVLVSLGFLVVGIPVYLYYNKKNKN